MANKMFYNDVWQILKQNIKKIWFVVFMISGLLILLNIFLGFSIYTQNFTDSIKDRLGIYFYISDESPNTYNKLMELRNVLENRWLETAFSSKDDAFNFLSNRIPDLMNSFDRFGISNPLPSTLYVMFQNQQQYDILRDTIIQYRDIIVNVDDINDTMNIQDQENRIMSMIRISRFVLLFSYFVVVFMFVVILTLCAYLVHTIFDKFHKNIEIKTLLWASMKQIISPFVVSSFYIVWWAYIICFLVMFVWISILSVISDPIFSESLWYLWGNNLLYCVIVLLGQILIILWGTMLFTYFYTYNLVKNIELN